MNALSLHTLKDFKNKKMKFIKFSYFNVSISLRLATMNINMSAKHVFRFHTKIINVIRATVYRVAITLDSKVAI